jgi:hypothetical protein
MQHALLQEAGALKLLQGMAEPNHILSGQSLEADQWLQRQSFAIRANDCRSDQHGSGNDYPEG